MTTSQRSSNSSDCPSVAPQAAEILAAYDRALFCAAANYDVDSPTDRRRSTRDLERLFFQLVRILQPELFIEAGAKDATASRRARRFLEQARIVAFEANPHTFARFSSTVDYAADRVEYTHLGLSDSVGSVTFNVQRDEAGAPRANGRGSLMNQQDCPDGTEAVTVPCTTLDEFFRDENYARSAMWVDVEGATELVLGGGPLALSKAAAVFIEVEDRSVWEGQWLRPDVSAHLFDAGLVPIARDFQSRYLYNILYVRTDLLNVDRLRWALTKWHSDAAGARLATATQSPRHGRGRDA